ncbi:MAG: hypothetical protein HY259_05535 [Chloroflexi bacterium]|nr:hypothetical protein [Chloroflexota bacterium]MBI3732903.1 hypothetical protein [Chloroflexota bacterium]
MSEPLSAAPEPSLGVPRALSTEQTFYADERVQVTNARACIHGKTYAMAHVTSVALIKIAPERFWGMLCAILGLMLAAVFFPLGVIAPRINVLQDFDPLLFSFTGALGLLAVVISLILLFRQKPDYAVRIGSASGESDALYSKDLTYIQQVITALNDSIVARG